MQGHPIDFDSINFWYSKSDILKNYYEYYIPNYLFMGKCTYIKYKVNFEWILEVLNLLNTLRFTNFFDILPLKILLIVSRKHSYC